LHQKSSRPLAVPHDSAWQIRDEVGFFQEVRAVRAKSIPERGGKSPEELELTVRQIVSRAISSDKVTDVFDAAGLKKPDISILFDEFLAEVQHLPQRDLAVKLLQKLLNNELKIRQKEYLVQSTPSPRCWRPPSAASKTAPSKPHRSPRN
jgi:type I restriction enzyme R subunit